MFMGWMGVVARLSVSESERNLMRTGSKLQQARLAYTPGEPLLESAREPLPAYLRVHGGGKGSKEISFFEIFEPGKDEFKGLKKGLEFLKFTPSEQEVMFNVIGGAVNLAAGLISIVGAATAALDLLQKLGVLGSKEDATQAALKQIGQRVEQIYGYLAGEERRGLYDESLEWRVDADHARLEVKNAAISRNSATIGTLIDRAAELDKAIFKMLDAGKGRIAFLRSVYGYHQSGHWIDGARTPFMATAGGTPVNYRDPAQELQGEIWDVGYYLDVLLRALTDRILVATTIEPAFRATGYDRAKFGLMAERLLGFIHAWRASIIVADPLYALNPGGALRSPYREGPLGIVVGAVDPVTGVSSFQPYWDGFTIIGTHTDLAWAAWGGGYDETRAKDPAAALAAVVPLHLSLVDQVVKACGLERLMSLQRQLRDLGSPPAYSDFVSLPDATFHRRLFLTEMWGPEMRTATDEGTPVTVDLGRLKVFARDPAKLYEGRRHDLRGYKRFVFRMARRADHSRVRLGYRLALSGSGLELATYQTGEGSGEDFPTAAIQKDFTIETKVFDVHQSDHLSNAEENLFERDGRVPGVERYFLNQRDGRVEFRLRVVFSPFAGGDPRAYAGEAAVTVEPLDRAEFPHASILHVVVYESRTGSNGSEEEVVADTMTLHLVPTYTILGAEYFAALRDAQARMAGTIRGLHDKLATEFLPVGPPDPDPAWRVRWRMGSIEQQLDALGRLQAGNGEVLAEVLGDHLAPIVRRIE